VSDSRTAALVVRAAKLPAEIEATLGAARTAFAV
jgi:hypothetical protein